MLTFFTLRCFWLIIAKVVRTKSIEYLIILLYREIRYQPILITHPCFLWIRSNDSFLMQTKDSLDIFIFWYKQLWQIVAAELKCKAITSKAAANISGRNGLKRSYIFKALNFWSIMQKTYAMLTILNRYRYIFIIIWS